MKKSRLIAASLKIDADLLEHLKNLAIGTTVQSGRYVFWSDLAREAIEARYPLHKIERATVTK